MENINTFLGIIASLLSIGAIIFSKLSSDRTKEIEKIINKELNIRIESSKNERNTIKRATSGENGTSVVGDNNKLSGEK
ncbi:TPA: hypothetical protein ACGBG5_003358 [Enterococcus faecalis]